MIGIISIIPQILSLFGVWQSSYDTFLWEGVKIFQKQSSDNPNDYWISYASGACLFTRSICTSARYNPSTRYLSFPSSSNRFVDGPWMLFVSPLPQSQDMKQAKQKTIFLTQSSLRQLSEKRPDLLLNAWNESNANKELMDYVVGVDYPPLWGALRLIEERENEVLQDDPLPHGAIWITSQLLSIDKAERERDNQLKKEGAGRLIALN